MENKSLKEFKRFLSEKCFSLESYRNGDYDKKIWSWFQKKKAKKSK